MNAKTLLAALGYLVVATATVKAEPAVYRDNTLSIASGIVVTGTKGQYYKDIVLQADADGKLKVVSASVRPLAYVNSVSPNVTETQTTRSVDVKVAGYISYGCLHLEETAVSRKDDVFVIVVATTTIPPGIACAAATAPFEITVPLDITGLPAGTYKVYANDVATSFVLTTKG